MSLTDNAKLVVESFSGQMADGVHYVYSPEAIKAAVQLARAVMDAVEEREGVCPYCRAVTIYCEPDLTEWKCGSHSRNHQSDECKDRQIAILTARLATVSADLAEHKRRLLEQSAVLNSVRQEREELKQRIAASPVAWVQFGNHNNPCEISEDRETFWAGEHPPGTLRKVRLLEVRDGE